MRIEQVPLYFMPGTAWVCLRELCGVDEQAVTGSGTLEALRLLDRLFVTDSETDTTPVKAKDLTIADRDRLLAAIYISTYGSHIEGTIHCKNCQIPFDMDFSLDELLTNLYSGINNLKVERDPAGYYILPEGPSFRLPTGEDERAIMGMSLNEAEQALLSRCTGKGKTEEDFSQIQQAMNDIAPVLDMELKAPCPECGQQNMVHFDIQYYLLNALHQGRHQLAFEVHRIASAYGWSLMEILNLPRSMRKTYVSIVESEMDSAKRSNI